MKKFLERYIPMADMVAKTFGEDCEVVIHDLSDPQHSVVYVANNSVTGRRIGDSFNQLVTDVMFSKALDEGFVANYYFTAENGRLIRSSTLLIYNNENRLAGAFCINFCVDKLNAAADYINQFLMKKQNANDGRGTSKPAADSDSTGVREMVETLVDNVMGSEDPQDMSKDDKVEKIKFMDEKGIFLMKGAVEMVASRMGVNKVTVYGYLDEARGKR